MSFPIEIKNLHFTYHKEKVLEDITLHFEKGKFYSIIGPNGSGKSTLLKNIGGTLGTQKKGIKIHQREIHTYRNKERARTIGVVSQHFMIEYEFTVHEVVLMGRNPYQKRFQELSVEDKEIARKYMELTHTWEMRNQLITELSGGELQRVIAARTLCQETDIVLLDEPTSHLDLQYQVEFLNLFKNLKEDKVIIAVLHDLNLASLYSDEIILLHQGRVIDKDVPAKIVTKENIKQVYQLEVEVLQNPGNQLPYMIPKV